MKKILISLIVLVAVCSAVLVGITVYMNQPEAVAIRAITGSVTQFVERDEIAFAYDTVRQGSIDFSVKEWEDEDGYDELEGGSVSGKLYFSDSSLMLKDFYLDLYDVKLDGNVYLSDEMVYVEENEILGEAYGVNFSDLASIFDKSIFSYDANSAYSLPEDVSDTIANYDHENSLAMKKDAEALAKKLIMDLWDSFCENASIESEIKEVRIGGEKIKARVICIEVTGDDLADFLEDAIVILEDHKELNDFIDTYDDELKELFSSLGLPTPEDLDESDSFRKIYDEYLEMLNEEMDDFCKEVKKEMETIDIEIVTPKLRSNLLLLTVEYDGDTVFSLDCGKEGIEGSDEIALEIYEERLVYKVEKDDNEDFILSVKYGGEKIFSIDVDKEKKEFSIFCGDKYDNYTLEGTFEKEGAATVLVLQEVTEEYYSYYNGSPIEYIYKTNTTITIKQKDKMPATPTEFKTIDSITEKDVDAWIEKLNNW